VRRSPEWSGGHIVQAVHMPLNHLTETAGSLNRDSKVSVICASGFRSSIAVSVLEQMGFGKVSNVIGGMTAWNNAKLLVA
jgi:hydroxyacylglutathione hydrolase